jgi:hypothetical protein
MVKIGKNKKNDSYFSKWMLFITIILLLVPTIFTIHSIQFRGKIKVGIVLTSDDLLDDAETAAEGLDDFHDIFSTKIVTTRFNESKVRTRNGSYLTDDYFDNDFGNEVRKKHNVDIIVIITNRSIDNWLGNSLAAWGQADTETGIALMTVSPVFGQENISENYIISTTRHEVLHLLGYHHPQDNRKCLMQYATLETELCSEYQLVLPYYAALWKIGFGQEPGRATFFILASLLILLSPLFVVTILVLQFLFKKYIHKKIQIDQNPLVLGIGGIYITIMIASAFVAPVFPQIILLLAVVFLYVIIEATLFEFQLKPKGEDTKE